MSVMEDPDELGYWIDPKDPPEFIFPPAEKITPGGDFENPFPGLTVDEMYWIGAAARNAEGGDHEKAAACRARAGYKNCND